MLNNLHETSKVSRRRNLTNFDRLDFEFMRTVMPKTVTNITTESHTHIPYYTAISVNSTS